MGTPFHSNNSGVKVMLPGSAGSPLGSIFRIMHIILPAIPPGSSMKYGFNDIVTEIRNMLPTWRSTIGNSPII